MNPLRLAVAWVAGVSFGVFPAVSFAQDASVANADLFTAGRQLMAAGEPAQAAQKFALAVQLDPNDAAALNNLATARAAQGDYRSAYDLLQRAAMLAPGRADIAANLAQLRGWLQARSTVTLTSPDEDRDVPEDASEAAVEVPALWGGGEDAGEVGPAVGSVGALSMPNPQPSLSESLSPGETVVDTSLAQAGKIPGR